VWDVLLSCSRAQGGCVFGLTACRELCDYPDDPPAPNQPKQRLRRARSATGEPVMNNPALTERTFQEVARTRTTESAMTLNGTIVKTGLLLLILVVAGAVSWQQVRTASADSNLWVLMLGGGILGGFVVALVTIFVPRVSPFTAPLYAALEGLALGVLSYITEARFQGIVVQAVLLTVGVLIIMLFLYLTRILQPTKKFVIGVIAATGAICLFYLASFLLMLFGVGTTYISEVLYGTGWLGIGFSVFVVVIAVLNLIIDFGFIENGVALGAPKYMEWYAGFGLLVTLIWLYIEILRLLSKLRSR
jgi:uncharacterized YccA/Bax inhibitor family protein